MPNNNLTYVPSEKWYPRITRDVKGLVLGQMCAVPIGFRTQQTIPCRAARRRG